jgi:hypothetical protein
MNAITRDALLDVLYELRASEDILPRTVKKYEQALKDLGIDYEEEL